MVTPAQLLLLLTSLLSGNKGQSPPLRSSVPQESVLISAHIGENVTLPCFYKDFQFKYVSWYKHILGQKPQIIASFDKYRSDLSLYNEFNNKLRFTVKIENLSNNLTISDLKLSDSATYFCIAGYQLHMNFSAAYTVDVKGSGSTIQTSVVQSSSENIHAGDSVTLKCTVHTGSCDGEHRVYWFKDSEDSQPGLIYTHGGRNDQCERINNIQTLSCVYNLHMKTLTESHAGIYYCAVVSCGHILFGNGTKVDLIVGQPNSWLVFFLTGSLTFMSVLVAYLVYKIKKQNYCQSKDESPAAACTPLTEIENEDAESLHYAALNVKKSKRSRRQRSDSIIDCVYASVKQQT